MVPTLVTSSGKVPYSTLVLSVAFVSTSTTVLNSWLLFKYKSTLELSRLLIGHQWIDVLSNQVDELVNDGLAAAILPEGLQINCFRLKLFPDFGTHDRSAFCTILFALKDIVWNVVAAVRDLPIVSSQAGRFESVLNDDSHNLLSPIRFVGSILHHSRIVLFHEDALPVDAEVCWHDG